MNHPIYTLFGDPTELQKQVDKGDINKLTLYLGSVRPTAKPVDLRRLASFLLNR